MVQIIFLSFTLMAHRLTDYGQARSDNEDGNGEVEANVMPIPLRDLDRGRAVAGLVWGRFTARRRPVIGRKIVRIVSLGIRVRPNRISFMSLVQTLNAWRLRGLCHTMDEDEEQIPRGRSPSQRTSGISLLLAVASQGHCTCGQGLRIPLNLVNNSFPVKDPVETDTVS